MKCPNCQYQTDLYYDGINTAELAHGYFFEIEAIGSRVDINEESISTTRVFGCPRCKIVFIDEY